MGQVVRIGDRSDHGGVMVSASGGFTVDGVDGCVSGDLHQCPIRNHNTTPVSSTGTATGASGRGIVRTGDRAGCGATLIGQGSTDSS